MMKNRICLLAIVFPLLVIFRLESATLLPGFSESVAANGISGATAMTFAPDGRLFVCEQGGQLRVIENGALLSVPFVSLTVDSTGERGLLGVAFDPNFANNHWIYVYYTARTPAVHNRVSRFTANGDVAVAGSEMVILDLDNLSTASNHNGGAIHFGPDGKLYIAAGENANGANAQTLANLLGKILRINADGSIPTDNPFYNSASGVNRAIWALGLRNPFTFDIQPGTGRMFINDVGQDTWEEIDQGAAGMNYGWPNCEGACSPADPSFVNPIYQYSHANGCAITGGAFYSPAANQFPGEYSGVYFFADLCGGWIGTLDPNNGNQVTTFATGLSSPVDLKVSADGALYHLDRGAGSVYRIDFSGSTEVVTLSLLTDPAGIQLTVDGQTVNTPSSFQSTVGSVHTISAATSTRVDRLNYTFAGWSDGGTQTHNIVTPSSDTTYLATYRKKGRK